MFGRTHKEPKAKTEQVVNQYKGLPSILHSVRWTQHLLAIIAEVLILASFAMSGMDVSLGGTMTGIVWLKWAWGAAFALGIDTCFIIAWVRVRQCVSNRTWGAFIWNGLLALGMSFIVFQPVALQLLQQTLAVNFDSALSALGINIVILVYARASVAVFLGAVLAMTNVESEMRDKGVQVSRKRRTFLPLQKLMDKYMPEIETGTIEQVNSVYVASVQDEQVALSEPEHIEKTGEQLHSVPKGKQVAQLHSVQVNTGKIRSLPVQKQGSSSPEQLTEQVRAVLLEQPGISVRKLAERVNIPPSTANNYMKRIRLEQGGESETSIASSKLSVIEQAMLDAITKNSDEARELSQLSQGQTIDEFTALLKQRYASYASYITPGRVANVMRVMSSRNEHHNENVTDELEVLRVGE